MFPRDGTSRCPFVTGQKKFLVPVSLCPGTRAGANSLDKLFCPGTSRVKITPQKPGKRHSKTGKRHYETGNGRSKTGKEVLKQEKDVLKQNKA